MFFYPHTQHQRETRSQPMSASQSIEGFEQNPSKSFPFLCSPISRPYLSHISTRCREIFCFSVCHGPLSKRQRATCSTDAPAYKVRGLAQGKLSIKLDNLISELLMILRSQKLTFYPNRLHPWNLQASATVVRRRG